jgi:hypothetical protein
LLRRDCGLVAMEIRTFRGMRSIFTMEAARKAYAFDLASVLGHAERLRPFEVTLSVAVDRGPQERRTAAATTAPERTAVHHQPLLCGSGGLVRSSVLGEPLRHYLNPDDLAFVELSVMTAFIGKARASCALTRGGNGTPVARLIQMQPGLSPRDEQEDVLAAI